MTPKEKAIELVDKFLIKVVSVYFIKESIPRMVNANLLKEPAKQCALISVDEIIKSGNGLISDLLDGYEDIEFKTYWQEVKQEIEKL